MTEKLMETFQNLFGADGDIRTYFAPGRVNLIGEHTDYNGGHVFPCALTLGTYAVARKRDDRVLRFYSENFASLGVIETSLDDLVPDEKADWTNYPKGVMWTFEKRGYKLPQGMDIAIYGDIPNGSGLSSSASLEVLTGIVLKDMFGFDEITMDSILKITSMVATVESWISLQVPWVKKTMRFSLTQILWNTNMHRLYSQMQKSLSQTVK